MLNDWEAIVAFVKHPELLPTNNEAERALRHAVISRRISQGTRTSEGSRAYSALLSVIETCRLRNVNPWDYIAEVIACGRRGLNPPPVPVGVVDLNFASRPKPLICKGYEVYFFPIHTSASSLKCLPRRA